MASHVDPTVASTVVTDAAETEWTPPLMPDDNQSLTPLDSDAIAAAILNIRSVRVNLDRDLAAFYRVKPIALRQAVKRNPEKFPADIMFQLTTGEAELLVSQSVIPSRRSLGGALP